MGTMGKLLGGALPLCFSRTNVTPGDHNAPVIYLEIH